MCTTGGWRCPSGLGGVRGRVRRSLFAGNIPCKSSARTASTWQNPPMGMNASSDGSGRVDATKVAHSTKFEAGERRTAKWHQFQRWVHNCWSRLRTWWIVADLRAGANPVLVGGIGFVLPVAVYVFLVSMGTHKVESEKYFHFLVNSTVAAAKLWRKDVCHQLWRLSSFS